MRTDSPMGLLSLPHIVGYVASFFDANGNLAHRCITQWARTTLALAGLRVHIEGQERLNPQNTYIFMPNHASFLDTLLAFAYIFLVIFVTSSRKTFFQFPSWAWFSGGLARSLWIGIIPGRR